MAQVKSEFDRFNCYEEPLPPAHRAIICATQIGSDSGVTSEFGLPPYFNTKDPPTRKSSEASISDESNASMLAESSSATLVGSPRKDSFDISEFCSEPQDSSFCEPDPLVADFTMNPDTAEHKAAVLLASWKEIDKDRGPEGKPIHFPWSYTRADEATRPEIMGGDETSGGTPVERCPPAYRGPCIHFCGV